ncbi:MAG: ferredoxin--NADP reductase [Pirellulaceae bacterium]|nr:ferredoxin--NADP reductase [Pirellulaceae bacterium]
MKWTPSTVVQKKIWADGLFTLRVTAPEVLPFSAGQFLHLAIVENDERTNRPYSVASPHGEHVDFFIVLVEDGKLTPKLWNLEAGDEIEISERAAGSFTLKKTPDAKHLWLVSTGTGLAPYIAMLRTAEPWQRYEKVIAVHGVRHRSDLAYQEEMDAYREQYGEQFAYIPMLSREDDEHALRGRIPQCLESGELERVAECELNQDQSAILLCGNPAMLDEMESRLGERGMVKHRKKAPGQIVLERYW